jgi:hypothetical protein
MFIKYNKIKLLIKLILLSFICQSSVYSNNIDDFKKTLPERCLNKKPSFEDSLYCIKKYFTVGGLPVNPKIMKEFLGEIYDSNLKVGKEVFSLDVLDSQSSEKYYIDVSNVKTYSILIMDELEPYKNFCTSLLINNKEEGEIFFSYYINGLTDNGIYIVRAAYYSGSKAMFEGLIFIRIVEATNLVNKKMILIQNLGFIELPGGDYYSRITVNGNKVHIETEDDVIYAIFSGTHNAGPIARRVNVKVSDLKELQIPVQPTGPLKDNVK